MTGFLASPLYTFPINTFIENNCVIFDTEEEHKLEYTLIHHKFKELTEALLEGFLLDFDIEPSAFAEVMKTDFEVDPGRISSDNLRWATTTLAAAEDYLLFRNMMTERSLELEAEVLRVVNEAFGPAGVDASENISDPSRADEDFEVALERGIEASIVDESIRVAEEEDEILHEALRLSAESYAREMREREWDPEELRRAMELSRLEWEALQKRLHDQHAATQRQIDVSLKEAASSAPKLKSAKKKKVLPKPPVVDPFARINDPFARNNTSPVAVGSTTGVAVETSATPSNTKASGPKGSEALDSGAHDTGSGLQPVPKAKLGKLEALPKLNLDRTVQAATAQQWVFTPIESDDTAASKIDVGSAPTSDAAEITIRRGKSIQESSAASVDTSAVIATDSKGIPNHDPFYRDGVSGVKVSSVSGSEDTDTMKPTLTAPSDSGQKASESLDDERRQHFLRQRDLLREKKKTERQQALQAWAENIKGEIAQSTPSGADTASKPPRSRRKDRSKGDSKPNGSSLRQALATRLSHEVIKGSNIRSESRRGKRK